MSVRHRVLAATVVAAAVFSTTAEARPGGGRVFGDLLKRIPDRSNVLMLVDVDGLFDSPTGRRENWRQKAAANPEGGMGLDPNVSKYAVAEELDYESMQEHWKVGLAQLRRPMTDKLETLAAREGGYVEKVESTEVAWTPRGFYLFHFPDELVGFSTPTERKAMVRWIGSALHHPREFAPGYADRAVFRADAGAQIALALDLTNAASPKLIEAWLKKFDVIKQTSTDPVLLAPRLASVKSASLVVKVDQTIEANLRIDFAAEIDYTAPVARTLILALLEEYGAELPEMKTWTLDFDKKTAVEMKGRLSAESIRKILSMAHLPHLSPDRTSVTDAPAPVKPEAEPKPPKPYVRQPENLSASQGYFRSVATLMDSLKSVNRPTYQSNKLWYERYAKQIEELPILNVDKDLLDWGSSVARTLREMSSGINYYAKNQSYSLASTANGYYGGYGYAIVNDRGMQAATIKRQSDAMMSVDLDKRWQAMESSVSDIRRKMVEKYQVDF